MQTNRLVDPEQLREAGQGMVLGFKRLKWAFLVELSLGLLSISCIIDFIRCNYQIVCLLFWRTVCTNYYFISDGLRGLSNSVSLATFCANDYGDWPTYPTFWYFGPFLFGSGERLLLPFGLHHILVSMIRFTEAGVQRWWLAKCLVR